MERKYGTTKSASDAISILKADHAKVDDLLAQYEKSKQQDQLDRKIELARRICKALTIHATVEEEIFYPEVNEAIDDQDLMDEAAVEHQALEQLIVEIEAMDATDDLFDAKVKVLGEYVKHHMKEEQEEMFPRAKKAGLDMEALGEQILQRKQELIEEMGGDEPDDKPKSRSDQRAAHSKG